jgi:hypothetical protein
VPATVPAVIPRLCVDSSSRLESSAGSRRVIDPPGGNRTGDPFKFTGRLPTTSLISHCGNVARVPIPSILIA